MGLTRPPFLPSRAQMNPAVTQLSLFDIAGTVGVGADISHINTRAQVKVRRRGAGKAHRYRRKLGPASGCRSRAAAAAY